MAYILEAPHFATGKMDINDNNEITFTFTGADISSIAINSSKCLNSMSGSNTSEFDEMFELLSESNVDFSVKTSFNKHKTGENKNNTESKPLDAEIILDLSAKYAGTTFNVSLDVRIFGDTYYVKIRKVPEFFKYILQAMQIDKNTWIKISPDDYSENINATFVQNGTENYFEPTKEYLGKTIKYFEENNLILFKNKQPTIENKNGQKIYKYEIGLSKDGVKSLIQYELDDFTKQITGTKYATKNTEEVLKRLYVVFLKNDVLNSLVEYIVDNTKISVSVDKEDYPVDN